jgi:hypothetical protein
MAQYGEGDSGLPEGWDVVSLHYEGQDPLILGPDDYLTDREIGQADAIRVMHYDSESDVGTYRTIHGADDWEGLVDLIEYLEDAYA